MVERIEFESSNPFEIHHILKHLHNTPKQTVFADLHLPEGDGPFGCVVSSHGSRGWSDHHAIHVANWLDAGFAVCQIHSFASREVDSVVDNQMFVTHAMMLADAFAVQSMLAKDPRIAKIGVTGWSLGGTVALYAAWKPIIKAFGAEPFAAHLPFYPAAHMRPVVQDWSTAPMLILHGDADDWTPLHFVQGLHPQIPHMELKVYEGCMHSFDSLEEKKWLDDAICIKTRTVKISAKGHMSGIWKFGIRFPLNEPRHRAFAFKILKNVGAHICGDAEARADAMERATAFWVSHLA